MTFYFSKQLQNHSLTWLMVTFVVSNINHSFKGHTYHPTYIYTYNIYPILHYPPLRSLANKHPRFFHFYPCKCLARYARSPNIHNDTHTNVPHTIVQFFLFSSLSCLLFLSRLLCSLPGPTVCPCCFAPKTDLS